MKSKNDQQIIIITGPTASGKTALSLDLAKKFGGEIICADSMTVYRGMDIGTDKPAFDMPAPSSVIPAEAGIQSIAGVPHHLVDILDPNQDFNVSIFQNLAWQKIKEIQSREKIPFLVGGAALYVDTIVYNYQIPEAKPDPALRKKLEEKSNEELWQELIKFNPEAELQIDKSNKRRLIRALEVSVQTGKPFTTQKKKQKLPDNVLYLAIDRDREELYERINKRVDGMMAKGFLDEVKNLYKKYDSCGAMQATGYRQLVQYLKGDLTFEEAIEKTKQAHRNYAKRQLTWLRRNPDVVWIKDKKEAEELVSRFVG